VLVSNQLRDTIHHYRALQRAADRDREDEIREAQRPQNRCDVNLEDAFRAKEARNETRIWA